MDTWRRGWRRTARSKRRRTTRTRRRRPVSSRLDTLRLGSLTKAMKATQRPMPMKSMRAQWPVSTHTQTTPMETVTERSSASVNRPHRPSEILLFFGVEEQGRTRYCGGEVVGGIRVVVVVD